MKLEVGILNKVKVEVGITKNEVGVVKKKKKKKKDVMARASGRKRAVVRSRIKAHNPSLKVIITKKYIPEFPTGNIKRVLVHVNRHDTVNQVPRRG